MKRLLIVLGFVIAWGLITGGMEARDAEITAAAVRDAHDKKITFSYPIDWTFTSTQCSYRKGCERTQFYVPSKQ